VSSGKIILLNGASSAGKTTLARAVLQQVDEPFLHFSIDHLRESGVVPFERIRTGDFSWPSMRAGFFQGFHNALPAFADAGNNMLVEHIVETPAWMATLSSLLAPFDVFFVGLHCPLVELERRESVRGDRHVGDARRDFEAIHAFARYDLELDSTISPERNAALLLGEWRRRQRPSAFDRMRAAR